MVTIKDLLEENFVQILSYLRATDLATCREVNKTVFSVERIGRAVSYLTTHIYTLPIAPLLKKITITANPKGGSGASSKAKLPMDETIFLRPDYLYVVEINSIMLCLTSPQPSNGKGYWISSSWVSNAKKYFEAIALPELQPQRKAPPAKKRLSKIRQRRGSDSLPPWPAMNADIVCPHDALSLPTKTPRAKRRVIESRMWHFLRRFYPEGAVFKCSCSHVCRICAAGNEEAKADAAEKREAAILVRQADLIPEALASLNARKSGVPSQCLTTRVAFYNELALLSCVEGSRSTNISDSNHNHSSNNRNNEDEEPERSTTPRHSPSSGSTTSTSVSPVSISPNTTPNESTISMELLMADQCNRRNHHQESSSLKGSSASIPPGTSINNAAAVITPPIGASSLKNHNIICENDSGVPSEGKGPNNTISPYLAGQQFIGSTPFADMDYFIDPATTVAPFAEASATAYTTMEEYQLSMMMEAASPAAAVELDPSRSTASAGTLYPATSNGIEDTFQQPLVPGLYNLMPKRWLQSWRRYTKDLTVSSLPHLDCTSFLCHSHGLLVIPPHIEEYLIGLRRSLLGGLGTYPGEIAEIITADEWDEMQNLFHGAADFNVRFCLDGSNVTW
eukprot:CAMPEP_0174968474 /NCGR_PEP_ID=MMETSP0004_2-20121128/8156_1 /TAXON_ID=420556 /ORGANISM="Ochromonas sp., Strain CCMP1393" /LENGTH=621 /DNA_ID=CAMNT_0016217715 /DNA_START=606 /DNA_END=2468 /DNA_ORIENTATION=-